MKLTDLHDELKAIIADRALTHGTLENTFRLMSERWSRVLGIKVPPSTTAWMMAEAKLARMDSGGYHRDHLMDAANYLLIAVHLSELEFIAQLEGTADD